ncbi:MAG: hypothetical protein E7293_03235 [Lachnospiraceae bacterium]|nr:hypothetical protein [Lachnospiraceae bacterium]
MIDLENGYVIVQTSANNFSLKQKYMGMRKGVETECLRLISHHGSVEDAIKSVSGLLQGCFGNEQRETLDGYLNRIESANTRLAESVSNSLMQRFYVYVPKGNGQSVDPHPIVNLIPVGRNNAISRKELLDACVTAGLVNSNKSDRAMRDLIKKARMDFVILNLSNGKGYYRLDSGIKASLEEIQDLQRYIRQEESRAKATFKNISMAKKLYEDYMAERI